MNGREIATRTLIQASVVAFLVSILMLVAKATEVLLLAFGGVLLAILFHGTAKWLSEKSGLAERWALATCLVVPLAITGWGGWLVTPAISDQAVELSDRIPRAVGQLEQQLGQTGWGRRLLDRKELLKDALPGDSNALGMAAGFFTSSFGALGNLVIALFIGLFLAISPHLYIHGFLHLVPPASRVRTREVLQQTGSALASWLIAKILAMAVIGVLTTVGLWSLGIDLALVLGLIAAILSFIPNIGPVVALVPAALIALIAGTGSLLYVVLLYVAVQTLESYVLTPMLQQRLVNLPPALTITMQVLLGVLVGALGVILAAPLTAAAMVMCRMWYVQDILGDQSGDK